MIASTGDTNTSSQVDVGGCEAASPSPFLTPSWASSPTESAFDGNILTFAVLSSFCIFLFVESFDLLGDGDGDGYGNDCICDGFAKHHIGAERDRPVK